MGVSGAASYAWFDFLLVALMSFATVLLRCCYLLSATISWLAAIYTLETNWSLNCWVLNMVSSSNTFICPSKVLNVKCFCDTLRDSTSSCTEYFVAGKSILCGSHSRGYASTICGKELSCVFVGCDVLINTFPPWDCKYSMNSTFGLVMLIGSVAWKGCLAIQYRSFVTGWD